LRPKRSVMLPLSTGQGKRPRLVSKLRPMAAPSVDTGVATTLGAGAVVVDFGVAGLVPVPEAVVCVAGCSAGFALAAFASYA
jgi:hypothetical protein